MRSSMMFVLVLALLAGCAGQKNEEKGTGEDGTALVHSYARPDEAVVEHLNLVASVDFEKQRISGRATFDVKIFEPASRIVFDVHNLAIKGVRVDGVETDQWWLGDVDSILGQALEIAVVPATTQVSIDYETGQGALALQWLKPEQTAGKEHPFLFTQSQAILARTWIPCQDSPGIRYTYEASIEVPSGLMAVMSASNPVEVDSSGIYHFEMKQPIPSYLMALAVGELQFREVGDRTGVYAEPSVLDAAAYEFEDMQKMLEAAEALYGDYAWERYDVLVLPPSFPFGGMENPRLTFATPTILAGDKSLTSLVAHELAHSWSGNLVTNRTWDDFWLNEGFTVYFERRIMESVYGKDYADMLAILGRQDLEKSLKDLADHPEDTHLKLKLENRDPDDGMSDIAYEKGYFFLRTLEERVSRPVFDAFLSNHFAQNAFRTITTEEFLSSLKHGLLVDNQAMYDSMLIEQWVYGPGIPSNCVEVESKLFEQVDDELVRWFGGIPASELDTAGWTTHQWLHFLRHQPRDLSLDRMRSLDQAFKLTQSGNSEIAAEWYVLSIYSGYTAADEAIEQFLTRVGRRKFLLPIYKAMLDKYPSSERAKMIYIKARPNYHSVTTNTLDALLKYNEYGQATPRAQ